MNQAWVRVALAALIAAPAAFPALAADDDARRKAAAGVYEREGQTRRELDSSLEAERQAEAALRQAEAALAKAREFKDSAAEAVALEAVGKASEAKALASRRAGETQRALDQLGIALSWSLPGGTAVAVPVLMKGTVQVRRGDRWVPLGAGTPLQVGDTVRTGLDGRARLVFNDGSVIEMGPKSEFTYDSSTPESSGYRLLQGVIHSVWRRGEGRRSEMRIRTPTAVAVVRGTEFDLRVDEQNLTHLSPYSGKIELAPGEKKAEWGKDRRWWQKGRRPDPPKALPEGAILRVAYAEGAVSVRGADGSSRGASAGQILRKGEKLAAGADGFAWVEMDGGIVAALKAGTELEAGTQGKSDKPLCALWKGLIHVFGRLREEADAARRPMFMTPNAVAAVRGTEFELSVLDGGLSDIAYADGTLEVTAREERLDLEKLRPWWDEPW